jgi:hypothetical protein
MKKLCYILTLSIVLIQFNALSQDYLWLTNGKKLQIGKYKIENPELISYQNKRGKTKTILSFDVFSINEIGGKEMVIYNPDTSYAGVFTVPEMRSFVKGQYDASKNFKSPWTSIGGIAVAGVSTFVINPMYVILLSTGYISIIGLSDPKDRRLNIPMEFADNEFYILGYKKEVKHKRIINAIIGSGIGVLVGFGTYSIVKAK